VRVRIRFAKTGKVRWTSHRDVARMWERAFRRAHLSLAYTQGFSPRPRVSFGLALPTGAESVAEYLDAELAPGVEVDVAALPGRLTPLLPTGVDVLAAALIDDRAESLQHEVTSCSWIVETAGAGPEELAALVAEAMAAASLVIPRERKGRTSHDDVRPAILSCTAVGTTLECELAAHPRTLRPSELVRALGSQLEVTRARRTNQWIERDGARSEPLPLHAPGVPHVTGRAS
jgi:radical SAM-linked protein